MTQKPIILIGGGGHTRVLVGMLRTLGWPVQGILTQDSKRLGTEILGVQVLGLEGEVTLDASAVTLVNGVGNRASRDGSGLQVRASVFQRYRAQGFHFLPVISTHAIIQPEVQYGEGVQIMPGAVIQPGAMIGENCIINTGAVIDHDVVLYPHVHVAPGAVLCGNVRVGEETHIGAGATIIQGIRVGSHVVIGAGATVTRHVPDGALVRPAASEQIKAL
ncbi:MAG: acetyltransferase [Rickettsiales bacterium]